MKESSDSQPHIIEAQGQVINPQDKVVLAAASVAVVPYAPILTQSGCWYLHSAESKN